VSPDVIVVGGGPAGSIAALLLARAGVRVRLFERSRMPRRKLCGDTINPGARAILNDLGLGRAAEQGALRVEGMIVTGGGTTVRAAYPPGVSGLSITRAVLDTRLLTAAARAGVDVNEGALVTGALVEGIGDRASVAGVRVLRVSSSRRRGGTRGSRSRWDSRDTRNARGGGPSAPTIPTLSMSGRSERCTSAAAITWGLPPYRAG
jgi:flavin-dependent dehydrogenase